MITAVHRFADGSGWLFQHDPRATTEDLPPDPCYFTRWIGDVPTGTPVSISHGFRFIRGSALHPSGETVAVVNGAPPDQLAIIETNTPRIRITRTIEPGGTGSKLAWSPDGSRLAVVEDHAVRVYDEQLLLIDEFAVPYACAVAFAPHKRILAIGSWEDGAILEFS